MARITSAGKINATSKPVQSNQRYGRGKVGQQIGIKPSVEQVEDRKRKERELKDAQEKLSKATSLDEYDRIRSSLPQWMLSSVATRAQVEKQIEIARQERIKSDTEKALAAARSYDERAKRYSDREGEARERGDSDSANRYDDRGDEARREANYWRQAINRFISKGASYSDANEWVGAKMSAWQSRREARRDARKRVKEIELARNAPGAQQIKVYKGGKLVEVQYTSADFKKSVSIKDPKQISAIVSPIPTKTTKLTNVDIVTQTKDGKLVNIQAYDPVKKKVVVDNAISATYTVEPKPISIKQPVISDGTTNVLSGVSGGVDSNEQSGNILGSLFGRASDYYKGFENKTSQGIKGWWQDTAGILVAGYEQSPELKPDNKTFSKLKSISEGNFSVAYDTELQRQVIEEPLSTGAKLVGSAAIAPVVTVSLIGADQAGFKKKLSESDSFTARVGGELIPETSGEILGLAAFSGGYKYLSPALKTGVSGGVSALGFKGAFDTELTAEQRVASGVIGGLGAFGLATETVPYARGLFGRFSPKFTRTKTAPEGYKFVDVKGDKSQFDIRLIPQGGRTKGPAYKTGAYGFSLKQQRQYIGKTGTVTSSARDLFGPLRKNVKIKTEQDPLGFYGTPFDLQSGAAQTRLSRLGLTSWADFFKFSKPGTKFTYKYEKPQIVFFENAKITKQGGKGTFKAVGNPSSELEVTALGNIISGGKKGTTTIFGQKVDIFSAKLGGGKPTPQNFAKQIRNIGISRRAGATYTSPFGATATAFSPFTRRVNRRTNRTVVPPRQVIRQPTRRQNQRTVTRQISRTIDPTYTVSPPPRRPDSPPTKPSFSPPSFRYDFEPYKPTRKPPVRFEGRSSRNPISGKYYDVQVKSKKKWRTVNQRPQSKSAGLDLGAEFADNTTSARFRLVPTRKKGNPVIFGSGYFGNTRGKYRNYRKIMKIPDATAMYLDYIEKKKHRTDRKGERRGLSVAKYQKQRNKNPLGSLF